MWLLWQQQACLFTGVNRMHSGTVLSVGHLHYGSIQSQTHHHCSYACKKYIFGRLKSVSQTQDGLKKWLKHLTGVSGYEAAKQTLVLIKEFGK